MTKFCSKLSSFSSLEEQTMESVHYRSVMFL